VSLTSPPLYGEDHESFRSSVRRLVQGEVLPHLDDWRASRQVPPNLLQTLGDQGFLGTDIPEDLGGSGTGDPRFTAVLVEEVVAVGATGLAVVLAQHCGVAVPAALRLPDGDDELRATAVMRAAAGEALLVPVVLDGQFEANGVPGASLADYFVAIQCDSKDEPRAGILARGAADVAAGAAPLGGRESGLGDVRFKSASLTAAVKNPDFLLMRRDVDLWAAVVAAAGARNALELARSYVIERKVFGRPLSSLENTRLRLAEVGADVSVIQGFISHCLDRLADGTLSAVDAAAARIAASDTFDRAADQALQLHGGYGYMREYPVSHAYADARFLRQCAATAGDPRPVLASALAL
jgi:acyl-CoA dehydrogenase